MNYLTPYRDYIKRPTGIRSLAAPIFMLAVLVLCTATAAAQNRGSITGIGDGSTRDDQQLSPVEEEMRAKREIEAAEKAHKENLNRARNLVSLSESLVRSYKTKHSLDREDSKNLEKAEKLVKKIRDAAGGSDPESDPGDYPRDLKAALLRLSELAESLKERVEKTPKRVISAAIIDEANVLLELIRFLRSIQTKA